MFALCPVMGGTGMPVKVIEAMAHGLPVIALRSTGQEIPVEHGETGFIAENAAEFAHYVVRLHSDRALCRKMGEAARNAISQHFSDQVLLQRLSEIAQGHPNVYRPKLEPAIGMNGLTRRLEDREQHIRNLEYIIQDKETHIRNLERQREENYRDWQAHTKNLESIILEKQTHIETLERQRERSDRGWQAHVKALLEHPKGLRERMARIRKIIFPKEP
jgi:hypothetical protein